MMTHPPSTDRPIDLAERLASLVARRSDAGGLVVLAASAGGLLALGCVLADLPGDYPLPLVVVQHLNPDYISHMAQLLARRTLLRVRDAEEGERLEPGTVYIARPGRHLLVTGDRLLSFSDAEPVHYARPAADLLFASAAEAYGVGAIAVVLTGTGVDGSRGVCEVKRRGGIVIAQDPAGAEFPGMPEAANSTGCVDLVLPLREIAGALVALAGEGAT
jgi:two-component system chemotaxis response regulator CheB